MPSRTPPAPTDAAPAARSTRDRLLDAVEQLLGEAGPRAATLDAVAAAAGVSKGGLLYHFGTKDALVEGLLERLRTLAAEDLARMRSAPEGAARYYVRTSVVASSDPLQRATIAALRLVQDADRRAVAAFTEVSEAWRVAIEEELGDRALSRVVQLVGDGLWMSASMGVVPPDVEEVLAALPGVPRPPGA